MPFIRESIVTTRNQDGTTHIAPMGVHELKEDLLIAPFKPSATLINLQRDKVAVINYPDDVRIYAGCITGRYRWPLAAAEVIDVPRLERCLAHTEVEVERFEDDEIRPRFVCRVEHEANHAPFHGFNRAQTAVIEAAILVTRLKMLPAEKIDSEIGYLKVAVEKTAGPREHEAWEWLMSAVDDFRRRS